MSICLVRIDDRLVHGQVVEGWIPFLKAERVLVVSAAAAADETQAALMKMALPEEIGFQVLTVEQAAQQEAFKEKGGPRTLVLAPGPLEVLGLLEHGIKFSRINIGGLHYSAGKVQLGRAIFLSGEDLQALKRISRCGVQLEGRALPGEKEVDLLSLLDGQAEKPVS